MANSALVIFVAVINPSLATLELSPSEVALVPFAGGYISIWEHGKVKGRYYAQPLVYLQPSSAITRNNILTRAAEMSFNIIMWSEEAQEASYLHIKRNVNRSVTRQSISLIPMQKIRIAWKSTAREIANEYQLVDSWQSNIHLPRLIAFRFRCSSLEHCDALREAMKTTPTDFDGLEVEYIINQQKTARREITIKGKHLTTGKLFTKLENMHSVGPIRYLNSEDAKNLALESANNIVSKVITDSNYAGSDDEVRVKDVILQILENYKTSSESFEPHMWNSVFWDSTWARPDKLTQSLNKLFSHHKNDSSHFYVCEKERERMKKGGGGFSVFGIGLQRKSGASTKDRNKLKMNKTLSNIRQRFGYVQWNGEKFTTKPMKLYRLNLSTMNRSTTLVTANIQVRSYETVHSVQVRTNLLTSNCSALLSPELVEGRINEKLDRLSLRLDIQGEKLVNQNKSLTSQTEKLANQEILLTKQLSRLAVQSRKLADLEGVLNLLKKSPGWPSGKFCILINSARCPGGFRRQRSTLQLNTSRGTKVSGGSTLNPEDPAFQHAGFKMFARQSSYDPTFRQYIIEVSICCK